MTHPWLTRLQRFLKQSPIIDALGGVPIFIVVGDDKKSVRAYERLIDGRKLEFFVKPQSAPLLLVDAETGSEWDQGHERLAGWTSVTAGAGAKRLLVRLENLPSENHDLSARQPLAESS